MPQEHFIGAGTIGHTDAGLKRASFDISMPSCAQDTAAFTIIRYSNACNSNGYYSHKDVELFIN
jgi:hypothetical protein